MGNHRKRVDPHVLPDDAEQFRGELLKTVVGQDRAVKQLVKEYVKISAKLSPKNRPISSLIFMGPTGVGKTEMVRALAKALHGDPSRFLQINCAEYQHGHEVAKLIGSPPGYLGHRETQPVLAQHKINLFSERSTTGILLVDEFEKAHNTLRDFFLGILDTGHAHLGDGSDVDFTNHIIVFTSNLGSQETQQLMTGSLGFQSATVEHDKLDADIYKTSKEALRKFLRPEFLNRIDRVIVFRSLDKVALRQIVVREIWKVQRQLFDTSRLIWFRLTDAAKEFLLKEGTSQQFGAREIRRAVERFITTPLSFLIASKSIGNYDNVVFDYIEGEKELAVFNCGSSNFIPTEWLRDVAHTDSLQPTP